MQSERLTVQITRYSSESGGITHVAGKVCFVPGAYPGETVVIELIENKKNFLRAHLLEVLQSHPARRRAPCPVFGRCGGCELQDLEYQAQVELKETWVKSSLSQIPGIDSAMWLPMQTSPSEFGYRDRVQLQVQNGRYGYFAKGTHDFVSIDHCFLVPTEINSSIKTGPPAELQQHEGLELSLLQGSVRLSPRDERHLFFNQVNPQINAVIQKTISGWLQASKFDWIWDLYAGAGNFSYTLAESLGSNAQLKAVEAHPGAIVALQNQLKDHSLLKKISPICQKVEVWLRRAAVPAGKGLVLVDPPRQGLHPEVIDYLIHLSNTKILYLSCDPGTLKRDLLKLCRRGNVRFEKIQLFDMFPQTNHVEALVSMTL